MRIVAMLLLLASGAQAQMLQGVVRDSVSRHPVPGVVVSIVDSSGRSLARGLTGETGAYRVTVPAGAARVRVQRLGFRMRELALDSARAEMAGLDVVLTALPSILEPVRVMTAARCPRRRDNADAQALFEQARSGLLATVVARETNPASVVRYAFDRPYHSWPDSAPPRVRIDSTIETTTSFRAVFSGEEFAQFGFQRRMDDRWQYFGPDAEVLLGDGFASAYCFSIADRDRMRRNLIGLSFAAATKQRGRVDITGTLWIDSVRRSLHNIEFKYTGEGSIESYLNTGGYTAFREMPNGVVVVTHWGLRLLTARADSTNARVGERAGGSRLLLMEGGGFLAKATWPDGTRWVAPMGTARIQLMSTPAAPAVGTQVWLDRTDYRGVTDTSGVVEIRDLFPGLYGLVVRDTLLEELGFDPEPIHEFHIEPGGVIEAKLRVRSTAEVLLGKCANKVSRPDLVAVIAVKDAAVGAPGVKVDVTFNGRVHSGTTGPRGTIVLCMDRSALGARVQMTGTRGDMQTQTIDHTIARRVTVFQLQLAARTRRP